jgi:hypothetical protein
VFKEAARLAYNRAKLEVDRLNVGLGSKASSKRLPCPNGSTNATIFRFMNENSKVPGDLQQNKTKIGH